jgi:hypothetical protein
MLDAASTILTSNLHAARRKASCYVGAMKPIEDVRRENLLTLVKKEGSQAAFARKIDKDKNQVNQWLGRANARNISADSARDVERAFGLAPGWLDTPRSKDERQEIAGRESQVERIDADKLGASIQALRQVAKNLEVPYDPETHPGATAAVYELALALSAAPSQAEVIDFGAKVAEILLRRGKGGGDGSGPGSGEKVGSGNRRRTGGEGQANSA